MSNLFEYLAIPTGRPAPPPELAALPVGPEEGIRLRRRRLPYPGAEGWALRHVSLFIPRGQSLALVGQNGAGKTTFIKLLTRLYEPDRGAHPARRPRPPRAGTRRRSAAASASSSRTSTSTSSRFRENVGLRQRRAPRGRARDRARGRARRRGRGGPRRCPRASRRRSGAGSRRAPSSRAGSGRRSRSRARSCARRPTSWSSTSRPRRSTPRPSTPSSSASGSSPAGARRSSSRTASPPCAWPTASSSSSRGRSSSRARTRSWSRRRPLRAPLHAAGAGLPVTIRAVCFDLLSALLDSWSVWDAVAAELGAGPSSAGPGGALPRAHLDRGRVPSYLDAGGAGRGVGRSPAGRQAGLERRWDPLRPWPDVGAVAAALGLPTAVVTNCSEELGRARPPAWECPSPWWSPPRTAGAYKPTLRPTGSPASASAPRRRRSPTSPARPSTPDGALASGFRVTWVNRLGAPVPPDARRGSRIVPALAGWSPRPRRCTGEVPMQGEMRTHRGACHCGRVQFEIKSTLDAARTAATARSANAGRR